MAVSRRYTIADLEQMPDDGNRYEVIDGALLGRSTPSLDHQRSVAALFRPPRHTRSG